MGERNKCGQCFRSYEVVLSQLPYYKEAFHNGKVIVDPSKDGVHWVISKSAGREAHPGYKNPEGTAKRKGKWPPPFNTSPFVVINAESLENSNVGLIHELLHHYYWALPHRFISEVEKQHDFFFESSIRITRHPQIDRSK